MQSEIDAKMVRNMFAASETAIHILNDLLHYEHIDAGDTYLPAVLKFVLWRTR